MAIKIAIYENRSEGTVFIAFTHFATEHELRVDNCGGGGDRVVRLEHYESDTAHSRVIEAIAETHGWDHSAGRELEAFAQYCFDLGFKLGFKQNETSIR
jgi:hypothetical protein